MMAARNTMIGPACKRTNDSNSWTTKRYFRCTTRPTRHFSLKTLQWHG